MNDIKSYPQKKVKKFKKERFFNYIVVSSNKKLLFRKRVGNDIWKNLYEFPLIEGKCSNLSQIVNKKEFNVLTNKMKKPPRFLQVVNVNHLLTHQILKIKFWIFNSEGCLDNTLSINEIIDLPKPAVIYDFINKHLKS
tara:strand:- start:441 stop:854 length:414 start_codon:yes stop_codon:yes gene_type:complete